MTTVVACLLLALLLGACIAPLQFEEQRDAGANEDNPPAILLSTANPSMLTSQIIDRSAPTIFTVQVEDKDPDDVLYLRVFRDYHISGEPAVTDLPLAHSDANSATVRTFEINTNTWCQGTTSTQPIMFEVLVSDRQFLPLSEEPLFRAVSPGAKTARSYWVATCQ